MKKMVVVDDEVEICEFLKLFFEERDFRVSAAYSGKQALAVIEQEKPNVVLLDVNMPDMDGLEVLKQIKAKKIKAKIIMVSAMETNEKIEEAMKLGADNYITKPLSLEYLEKDVQEKIEQLSET